MAYAYQSDTYCDKCGESIKRDIAQQLANKLSRQEVIGQLETIGIACYDEESTSELRECLAENYLDNGELLGFPFADETNYDSDEYPKHGDDDEETDSPCHCASGEDCEQAEVLADGSKVGHLIGTSLTDEGIRYVNEAIRGDGACVQLWRERFADIIEDEQDEDNEDEEDIDSCSSPDGHKWNPDDYCVHCGADGRG